MDPSISILHITPHLGGGVGRVLLNYFTIEKDSCFCDHRLACLDYANENAIITAKNIKLKLVDKMDGKVQQLCEMIKDADIVLIHWWNHPLLYNFLVRTKLPPCRVIIWSHISGFYPPYVFTDKILQYPDLFVFTTPVSYETKEIRKLSENKKRKLLVVWSTAGVEHVNKVKPKTHKGFNVGYIGTVDYCKMHPGFLKMCSRIDVPGVKFIICGGPSEKEISNEAKKMGISKKFNFTGLVSDINKYLPLYDVFGYPLAPWHYGTCDQVLTESMAAGVVPVVLTNRMESYMVKNGVTGIVAKNENEYIKAIEKLYKNKNLRSFLSNNAKEYAAKTFSLVKLKQEWEKVYKEALTFPKTIRKWKNSKPAEEISANDVFLESLGVYGKVFSNYISTNSAKEKNRFTFKIKKLTDSAFWQTKTRGTVYHYNEFFPNDEYLSEWCSIMEK